jgi:hypothetical protein
MVRHPLAFLFFFTANHFHSTSRLIPSSQASSTRCTAMAPRRGTSPPRGARTSRL